MPFCKDMLFPVDCTLNNLILARFGAEYAPIHVFYSFTKTLEANLPQLSEIGQERGQVSEFEVNTLLARVTVYGWSLTGRYISNRHI